MPGALRRSWAPLSRLLAERSSRGRTASYVLALVALLLAAWALYTFFPGRSEPTVRLLLPLPPDGIGELDRIRVWPGMPLRVTGADHTDLSTVELELSDRLLARVRADGNGRFRTEVRVPRDLAPGTHVFVVRDRGSGTVTVREEVVVEDPSEPALALQPDTVPAGGHVALTGGGFPGRLLLVLELDPDSTTRRTIGRVRSRPNGLVFARVAVPADLPSGEHRLVTVTPAGVPVGRAAIFEVTG